MERCVKDADVILYISPCPVWPQRGEHVLRLYEVVHACWLAVDVPSSKLDAHGSPPLPCARIAFQQRSTTLYISGAYALSFTTRPSTSTQACALNGNCWAPIAIRAGTPCTLRRQAVAADRCRHNTCFQYQMHAVSTAAQISSIVLPLGGRILTGQSRTFWYSAAKFPRARYRSKRTSST